jgi:hypothetical protein
MTTTAEPRRDHAGLLGEPVPPRLPDLIDGWVRDGLVSAHLAMKVFSPGIGAPETRTSVSDSSHGRPMAHPGYIGAVVIAVAGLLVLFDDGIGVAARLVVGVLSLIAMRHTMWPAPASRRWGSHPATPRHRHVRRNRGKDRS